MESRLEMSEYQEPYLICYYDSELRNWAEVIQAAMQKHKVDAKTPILCLPKKGAFDGIP